MAKQVVNIGAVANDGTGTNQRDAWDIFNDNMTELFDFKDSQDTILISQESDFPVQDATTITLESKVDYKITADVTTAKKFIVKDAAVLRASSSIGFTLTYTGTGSMFDITDASFAMRRIKLLHATAQGINFVDTVGGTFAYLAENVTHLAGSKYATFSNPGFVLIEKGAAFNMTAGATFSGANIQLVEMDGMTMTSTSSSFKAIDLGSSVTLTPEFKDVGVLAPAGAFGISGLSGSGNVATGFRGMVIGCEFVGGMTALENIQSSDLQWQFNDNDPIPDSRNAADIFMTGGSETITTGSAGDWQEIGIPSVATWSSDISDRFTVGTNGVLTYIGLRDIEVIMSGRATVEKSGGGSDVLEVRLAKNWDGTASDAGLEKSRAQTQSADPTTVPIGALTKLSTNDNIRAIFSNTTGTSNIVASVSALEIID